MKAVNLLIFAFLFTASLLSQNINLRNPSEQYDYVVITTTNFQNEFDDFVAHKENVKSLKCAVINIDKVYSEFSEFEHPNQSIRGFISYAGKNWPEPQPKYFLIAGDVDAIPNFKVEGVREIDTVLTDYYYAVDIESKDETKIDYFVGRIAARTSLELSNYLYKVISYESTPADDWNNKIMLVGADVAEGELFKRKTQEFADNLFDYLIPTIFLSPSMYDESELKNNIVNGINIEGYSSVFLWSAQSDNLVFGEPAVLDMNSINDINTDYFSFISFIGQQKFSNNNSSGLLDQLLFNKKGAIAGFNAVAPYYVNLMSEFYTEYTKYLYGENGNSIAGAAAKVFNSESNSSIRYIRNDLFGVFGDPSLILKYDIVASTGREEIVNNFELYQNYPNPFNPTTQIVFSLPESAYVDLKIYDLLGREVASIIQRNMNSGEHTINFNASSLSSGIYLYQIKAGIYNQTRKMILIK